MKMESDRNASTLDEIKKELKEIKGLLLTLNPQSLLIQKTAPLTPRQVAVQFCKLTDEAEIQAEIRALYQAKMAGHLEFLPRGRGYVVFLNQPYFKSQKIKKERVELQGPFFKRLKAGL